MRKLLTVILTAALLGGMSAQAFGATRNVRVADDFFVRDGRAPTVTVDQGDKVRWRWSGRHPHNVQVQRGPATFQSRVQRDGTFTRTLRRRGTYRIVCSIHAPDMRMKLVVD